MRIVWVDYCYAEQCGDEIRVHQDLYYKDKELYNHAIEHEKAHLDNENIWQDIKLDFSDMLNVKIQTKAFLFMLKRPKLIIRMISPIHFNKKGGLIEVNWVLVLTYLMYSLGLVVIFK